MLTSKFLIHRPVAQQLTWPAHLFLDNSCVNICLVIYVRNIEVTEPSVNALRPNVYSEYSLRIKSKASALLKLFKTYSSKSYFKFCHQPNCLNLFYSC